MSNAYLRSMSARVITMLAILALTVVTTVTSAHAARMSMTSGADHTMHAADMMHAPVSADFGCDAGQNCGTADAEMCKFVCACLSVVLTSPGGVAMLVFRRVRHALPPEAIHVSRTPGLNERPPKLRLL